MPWGDRTGPIRYGPMTGRGAGFCAGYPMPGFANPRWGQGFGWGSGRGWRVGRRGGWGRRNWFRATGLTGRQRTPYGHPGLWGSAPFGAPRAPYGSGLSKEDELNELNYQAEYLEDALKEIKQRMSEIEERHA